MNIFWLLGVVGKWCVMVGIFWLVVSGGGYILGWWCVVVGSGGYILAGGG